MAAITRLATYVPAGRLDTAEVRRHWPGTGSAPGVRTVAVADVDEDVVTFGAQVLDDLFTIGDADGSEVADVDALIVTTCSSPYAEHSVAAEIARALDLPSSTLAIDLAASVRGAVDALALAAAGVESGRWRRVAVVAADLRRGATGTAVEALGCAAGAALVEPEAGVEIGAVVTERRGVPTRWRPDGAPAVRLYDDARFERDELVIPAVRAAVATAAPDASFIAGNYTDARLATALATACGVEGSRGDDDVAETGDLGTAGPLVALARCLEEVEPGTTGVLVGAEAGAGADALALTVSTRISVRRRAPAEQLISYVSFLQRIGVLPSSGLAPIVPWAATPGAHRDDLAGSLVGSECADCGSVSIPPRPLCVDCGSDRSAPRGVPRRGRLVTHNRQHVVAISPEPAPVAVGVARIDGLRGNRGGQVSAMFCESLDGLAVGAAVELVYRRLGADEGLVKYGWKLRLVDGSDV